MKNLINRIMFALEINKISERVDHNVFSSLYAQDCNYNNKIIILPDLCAN